MGSEDRQLSPSEAFRRAGERYAEYLAGAEEARRSRVLALGKAAESVQNHRRWVWSLLLTIGVLIVGGAMATWFLLPGDSIYNVQTDQYFAAVAVTIPLLLVALLSRADEFTRRQSVLLNALRDSLKPISTFRDVKRVEATESDAPYQNFGVGPVSALYLLQTGVAAAVCLGIASEAVALFALAVSANSLMQGLSAVGLVVIGAVFLALELALLRSADGDLTRILEHKQKLEDEMNAVGRASDSGGKLSGLS